MDQPEPNEALATQGRRARRLLFVLMAVFIVLPFLVLLFRSP